MDHGFLTRLQLRLLTRDIWIFNARSQLPYNTLYDLMQQAGVSLRNMRVCEPFGPEQRRGLWLYHILEPDTWERLCHRVSGAHCGGIYANETGAYYALRKKISKPAQHTWHSYAMFLLESMPPSIIAIKFQFICNGTGAEGFLRTYLMNRIMTWGFGIFRPGGVSARLSSKMISGVKRSLSAQPNHSITRVIARISVSASLRTSGYFCPTCGP